MGTALLFVGVKDKEHIDIQNRKKNLTSLTWSSYVPGYVFW